MPRKLALLASLCAFFALPGQGRAEDQTEEKLRERAVDALALWRDSCVKPAASGDCFSLQRIKLKNACQSSVLLAVPHKRKVARAKRAQKLLTTLLAEYQESNLRGASESLSPLVAEMEFAVAEQSLEEALRMQSPKGLSFDPKDPKRVKESSQRFTDFVAAFQGHSERTMAAYKEVIKLARGGAGMNSLRGVANAHVAVLLDHFSGLLYSMNIPSDIRASGPYASDGIDAYCDALATMVPPLRDRSREFASQCLQLLSESDPRVGLCEQTLRPMGELGDARVVRRIFRTKGRAMRSCYEAELERKPKLAGTMRVALEIGSSGQVVGSTLSGMEDKELKACMAKKLSSLEFPRAGGSASATVHETYRFAPN